MCLQNQPSQQPPNLLRQLFKTETSLDQYRKDLSEAENKKEIIQLGFRQMILKYTAHANSTQCTTVKLLASNIVEDLKNILAVADSTAHEILKK